MDTSYLFPFFLIETDIKGYEDDISFILNDEINTYYYSNISLVELKWQYIKLERTNDRYELQSKFSRFQNIVLKDKRLNMINHSNTDINSISDQIRNEGHSDYFDTIIAASSLWYCDFLITEDDTLKDRTNKVNNDYKHNNNFNVFNWRELRTKLSKEK